MRSVSGLRGIVGEDLVPAVVTRYAQAFGAFVAGRGGHAVALARDSRQSGQYSLNWAEVKSGRRFTMRTILIVSVLRILKV